MESLSSLLFICDCRHIPDTALLSSMFLMNLFNGYVDINAFFFQGNGAVLALFSVVQAA